jgi:hypothetical protein
MITPIQLWYFCNASLFLRCVTIPAPIFVAVSPIETGAVSCITRLICTRRQITIGGGPSKRDSVRFKRLAFFPRRPLSKRLHDHWVALAEQVEWLERWRMADSKSGPPIFPPGVRVLHLEPVRRAVLAVRQLARSRLHQYTQAEAAASCSPVVADLCLKLTCESPQPHMKFRTD